MAPEIAERLTAGDLKDWSQTGTEYTDAIRPAQGPVLLYSAPREVFVLYFDRQGRLVEVAQAWGRPRSKHRR